MIKKVLLINPSNTMPADSIRRLATPLGLLYIAAVLENDYQVKIIDSTCEGYFNHYFSADKTYITYGLSDADIKKQIVDFAPDIVGITCMFTARTKDALRTCKLVKEVNTEIPVVLGGLQSSLFPNEMLSSGAVDFIVLGEGEFRLKSLIESLNKGKLPDFDGIAYVKDGEHIINPMQSRIQDLDSIPLPARHLVNMEKYIEIGVPFAPFSRRDRVEQILTSRGCPQHCNFCSSVAYWGRQFRSSSVDNIIKEIELLVSRYNIQEIQFTDDNMTINKKHAMELFTRLKDFNLSWCTPNGLMMATLDEKMIKLMAQSGAYQISCAIESGSPRVREEIIHKSVPPIDKVKRLVDIARENGIQVHGMFVTGFPGETREEISETLDYPFKVGFDSASFFIATPLPGSELYDYCRDKGYLPANPERIDFKSANINIPRNSPDYIIDPAELEALVDAKTREFNEFSKLRDPQAWDIKFKRFLDRHPDDADMILGRVT
jgi:anaerobic magnesium-protoporphyrin IX monomethyl ester cyclase